MYIVLSGSVSGWLTITKRASGWLAATNLTNLLTINFFTYNCWYENGTEIIERQVCIFYCFG
jgi:hypothetical protein